MSRKEWNFRGKISKLDGRFNYFFLRSVVFKRITFGDINFLLLLKPFEVLYILLTWASKKHVPSFEQLDREEDGIPVNCVQVRLLKTSFWQKKLSQLQRINKKFSLVYLKKWGSMAPSRRFKLEVIVFNLDGCTSDQKLSRFLSIKEEWVWKSPKFRELNWIFFQKL